MSKDVPGESLVEMVKQLRAENTAAHHDLYDLLRTQNTRLQSLERWRSALAGAGLVLTIIFTGAIAALWQKIISLLP